MTCPGVKETLRAELAIRPCVDPARGLIVLFTGSGGATWWTDQVPEAAGFAEDLGALGFWIIQVRWTQYWLTSSPGVDAGTAHMACRPATVIKYLHDTYYVPLGIPKQVGRAGFCVSGNSGGATQITYALSHYGLDDILDVVVPSSGPPHGALAKSCLEKPGEEAYWFDLDTRQFIDTAFGYQDGNGPAATLDATFTARWLEESQSTGGNDYVHPTTRIHFIIGANDNPAIGKVSGDYSGRLIAEGSPQVTVEVAPNTPHRIMSSPEGRAALWAAILDE